MFFVFFCCRNPLRCYRRSQNLWDRSATCSSHRVQTLRKFCERKRPSQKVIQHSEPHERSPHAPSLKTDLSKKPWHKSDAPAEMRGKWRKVPQAQRKGSSHILLAFRSVVITSAIVDETQGKMSFGTIGASMHMLSRKDLDSAELDTVRVSRNPKTVITANGEVQTKRLQTLRRSRIFVRVDKWSKTTIFFQRLNVQCNTEKLCTVRCPRMTVLSDVSLENITDTQPWYRI